ncbi:MAG: class I SAM-dependent methyltransferase [Ktedonobacterales bacterium]|nr:class I SAM-dependent methyltransferase [Ktedonobacterales bacterium]
MDEWYRAYYRTHYADSVRHLLTGERSLAEIEFILRLTGLKPPVPIADVACGEGRHAAILAARGFRLLGVDQNADFLARARATTPTSAHAEFVVGDMREAVGGPYELVLSLFHSFGFFSDADNARMVRAWGERLAPGGYFVLDIWNRDRILRHFQPERTWQASPELRVTERSVFDALSGRLAIHYVYAYAEGRQHSYDASFRLYTPPEIRDLFHAAGMTISAVYGSLTGDPYGLDAPRCVAFGRKAGRASLGVDVPGRVETNPRMPVVGDEERA